MDVITLHNLLPDVFIGVEKDAPIRDSQLWLRDLSFEKGKFYLVTAESGTGKSSLCSYIYGNRNDYQGKIFFNNSDIRSFSVSDWSEIRQHNLAYLPQEMRLFSELTAIENVLLKNNLTNHKTETEISRLFQILDLSHKINTPISKLSIGQQQRVGIIRTLCQPFDFMLLDEPVSHLDEKNNKIVAELVTDEARKQNASIIATSVGNHLSIDADIQISL